LLTVFLIATVFVVSLLTSAALSSLENKKNAQLYIDDLKRQGFDVEYIASFGGKSIVVT
jgi:hypothetical protein